MKYLICFFILITSASYAQVYQPVSFHFNGTPTNGVKIKTNIPFTPGGHMPTIILEGYNYATGDAIGITINYYLYSTTGSTTDPSTFYFVKSDAASHGGYTPQIKLSNENNKIVIFIDSKDYFIRFMVRAFSKGLSEQSTWFDGWTIVDEALATPEYATHQTNVQYRNRFKNEVYLDGWLSVGASTPSSNITISRPLSSTNSVSVNNFSTIKKGSTSITYYNTSATTEADSFTVNNITHYGINQAVPGAGSSITNQYGFFVGGSFQYATNNYGFYGGVPTGTGKWNLYMAGAANNYLASSLVIGATNIGGTSLKISKIINETNSVGVRSDGQVQGTVSDAYYYRTDANKLAGAAANNSITHYLANQLSISTVTSQMGFSVGSTLIGASNNYGFFGNVPSGTGRWNLYMGGTANNFLNGRLGIGTTTIDFSNISLSLPMTGATSFYSLYNYGIIQSDVTNTATYYRTAAGIQASEVPLANVVHYGAYQGSFNGRSVTNQYGVYISDNMIGATNNYGILSAIPAATGRWNLFMAGSADNYINGNLGIGISTPTAKLEVRNPANGGVSQTNPLISARGTGNSIEFGHPNAAGYASTLGAGSYNGRPFLCFNCEAGTNINTFRTRGIIGTIMSADLTGALLFGRVENGNADNQNMTTDVTIKGGQMGIATTSIPSDYKLAIGGSMIAEKVKVKKRVGGVWPDYVFSPDYKLPSLEEVEKFTKENSHLPEIPSAKEVENEGQDLGEMNRLLLKKVEELTLYMIEQNKEIKVLKSKVEQLEKNK